MRVSFLCISYESGRDGVGDYVAQFARALCQREHKCQVIALADRFVKSPSIGWDAPGPFEVVRIPARSWQRADIGIAEERLSKFAPDWISLQMVSYGFEKQGLLWRSARQFDHLRGACRRHMMFHEIWIGDSDRNSLGDRILGWLQRRLLLRATQIWAPTVIHTSNPLYCELLRRAGVEALELPIPGNIPVCPVEAASARRILLERAGVHDCDLDVALLAGVFGTAHREWASSDWLERLSEVARQVGRRLVLIQFGRSGAIGREVFADLSKRLRSAVHFVELGELTGKDVSEVLQGLDFGVATSPWPLVGKSGTVAAMLEHGLPVLVTRSDLQLRVGPTPEPSAHPLLYTFDDFCSTLRGRGLRRTTPRRRLDIYESFLSALQSSP